ncbi:unnamed protein product [Owenia fusiformis]|uniref:non-specific serine/threonine protein kinase n=1 Tax=Owenia fusiformis TaxID=6347 RepID=A0A8J1Y4D4_OWEFU|nr:unnamed protein product [Owenia fusiformis]
MNGLMHTENIAKKMKSKIKTEQFSDFYTIEEEIGRGKFAVVKLCSHRDTGYKFAAKFLKKRRRGKDCREVILQEIVMLEMALVHPRLIDLVEVYETRHEIVLITEYAAGGELFHQCVVEESFRERDVIRLMRQILEGLIFLHDRNIVHLDLKPQNILLTKEHPEGDIKLCDFGFARLVNMDEDIRDIIGTPDYVAPEILSYEPIKTSTDMWGVGVLAYVMLTAHSPYAGDNNQETFCNISQNALEFPEELFDNISENAQDFIKKVLVLDQDERMTARDSLSHPWLRNEDMIHVTNIVHTPIGSPIGHRRAHSPPTKETSICLTKKYKLDQNEGDDNAKNNVDENLNNTIDKDNLNIAECLNVNIIQHIDGASVSLESALNDNQKENADANVQTVDNIEMKTSCSMNSVESCISMTSVNSTNTSVNGSMDSVNESEEENGLCMSTSSENGLCISTSSVILELVCTKDTNIEVV